VTAVAAPAADLAPRTASFDPGQFPIPSGREEQWRFAPLDRFRWALEAQPAAGAVHAAGQGSGQSFVRNEPLPAPDAKAWIPTDLPAAIARAGARNAVLVRIPADAIIDEPIRVELAADADLSYQHVEVHAGAFSRASVVIVLPGSAAVSGAIVVHVGDGASLQVTAIADGANQVVASWPAMLGRDASYTGCMVTLGGRAVRIQPSVHYLGPGGRAELLGVFHADGADYLEHRVFVDHDQPRCTSNVVYKGALSGEQAHSVWIGDVLVRRAATGINTYEVNRNLLLNDGPRADSVPNLELETGDVDGAGHASATGRFDEQQLFYLMSRGIPETVARQLVVRGFFADVLARLGMAELQADIVGRIAARLGLDLETGDGDE